MKAGPLRLEHLTLLSGLIQIAAMSRPHTCSSRDSHQSSRSSSGTDPNKPSTSYCIPTKDSYLDVPVDQPTFLKSSTYGQISYEVDDTNSSFNYSYNPQRTFGSHITPSVSKYLEDTCYSGHGMLDADPEYHLANAPASVPPNFSYLSEIQESGDFSNVQSPHDDARFSTPGCLPDSLPISAPMSSEDHYVPSPICESESSTVTLNDSEQTAVIVGQGAKSTRLKRAESIRYESPKNYDQNSIMKTLRPTSSEEMNSFDDVELRNSSHGDNVSQLDTDESDGRVSIVDRLFAMLQRAERESDEFMADDVGNEASQGSNAQVSKANPTSTLTESFASSRFQQTCYPHPMAQFRTVSQCENAQNMVSGMPHFSQQHHIRREYFNDSYFHSNTTEDPVFLSVTAAPPFPPQYYSQYALHQNSQQGNHIPAIYSQTPAYGASTAYLQQQERTHHYFQPPVVETINQFPVANYPAMQFFYPPHSSNISLYGQPGMFTQPQFIPQTLGQESLLCHEHEDNTALEPVRCEEASRESISSDGESETDVDAFDSISARQSVDQEEINEVQEEPRLKGPPFEQKGPTQTKEIQPVPPPPPSSPADVSRRTHLEGMDRNSIIEQLTHEMDRMEDISFHQIANYDREEELRNLCEKMNSRFQRFYPHLNVQSDEDETDKNALDEEIIEDGDPEDGYVMRNSVQLTTKYLALWFPEKKEREQMIPWNIMRKVKPVRLCFLDNRIGHGEFANFNIGEFVNTTGHMMFAYGDGPEALDESRLFVLNIVRQQMNMLLRRIWRDIVQTHQRKIITYSNIFNLYKNHPIRLRRLVRYLIEQNRTRHMLYRLMVDQGRRRGQHYIENRMGTDEKGATEVILLRKRAPHIYNALKANYEDQLDFLCEERRIQDCDPDLAKIKMFLKHRNRHLSEEHKELLNYARRVSYCSRTGRLSAFRAHRFHEFLGFPDLQTDLIYVLDFIAREIVMEITYHAAIVRQQKRQTVPTSSQGFLHQPISKAKLAAESMELWHYEDGLRAIVGWRKNEDILFGEDERKVMLSYGKNPRKWESDNDYNKRAAVERREFEDLRPMPRHTVCFTSTELFEEHKKVLRGEYWDSCPEDLTKEAFVLANSHAEARRAQVSIPQPNISQKWREQNEQDIKKENERLDKLRALNSEGEHFKRLTEQLINMMEKNSIHESNATSNIVESGARGNGGPDVSSIMKTIRAVVRRHKSFINI